MRDEIQDWLLKGLALLLGAVVQSAITISFLVSLITDTLRPLLITTGVVAGVTALGFAMYGLLRLYNRKAAEAAAFEIKVPTAKNRS